MNTSDWAIKGIVILLFTLLCACVPITERPVAPMDLPKNFSMQGKVPPRAKWWLDFQDSELTLLIDQAITENFSLRIAKERIVETEAIARQVGASLMPVLDGQGSISKTRDYQLKSSRKNYFMGLEASYEIDLWGRLRAQRDAAVLDAKATEADYHTAVISIAAEVATTWYQLVETSMQVELLTQQKETNTKVLELITVQFRSGKVGIADVLQQRQLVENNVASLAGLQADVGVFEHQLAVLIGVPPGTATFPQKVKLPSLPTLPDTGIPLDLLTNRPDIESSFLRLQAADNRVAQAIADRFPKLSISADVSTSGEHSSQLFNDWFSTLGANLLGPIFDGGRRKEEVLKNESISRQRFYTHGQTILEAIGEVENSLIREREQKVILASQKTQLQYATETVEYVGNRYRQGAEGYLRVLQALVSQQGLQKNILTSRRQLINFRISLYRALSVRIPLQETNPVALNSIDPPVPYDNQTRGSNQ